MTQTKQPPEIPARFSPILPIECGEDNDEKTIAEAERLVAEWEPNPAECEIGTDGTIDWANDRLGSNRPFAERRPNGRFLIRKQPLRVAPMNGRFWPIPAV